MHALSEMHPAIASEFFSGKFTVNKTMQTFSAIALYQAHEQLSAIVKSNGGAIGLAENPAALLRWIVTGFDVAHLISQFDSLLNGGQGLAVLRREQISSVQSIFIKHIKAVVVAFED
jgi:hypothetical protein